MSDVGRVHGPSGSEPGAGRKDRTKIDDTFTKIMEVGNIDETDPHKKKGKQKTVAETEDVESGLKAASGKTTTANVKPMEQLETPLAIRKPETTKQPKLPAATAQPTSFTPLAAFNEQEIEDYAWEEEAVATTSAEFTGRAQAEYTPSSTFSTETTATETTSTLSRGGPSMAADTDFAEEARGGGATSYQEEWPQTASYSPSSTFRSYSPREQEREQVYPTSTSKEQRPSRTESREEFRPREQQQKPPPSAPKAKEAPSKEEEPEEVAPAQAEALKPKPAKGKKAPPPGPPILPGQKEVAPSFAELMEEEKIKKEKALPSSIPTKPTVSAPLTPKVPPESVPREIEVGEKKVIPTALPGIPTAAAGVLSEKPSVRATPSSRKQIEEGEVEGMIRPMPLAASPAGQETDQGGEQEKQRREKREGKPAEHVIPTGMPTPAAVVPLSSIQATAPIAPSPYSQMDPQIMAMFERMVGVMTIAHTTGISETTMTLNARQFATSVLYGSQIVIREFSTAPKAFNVEFVGSPQALALVQQNVPALMGAVQQGNFNFTINRFDVKLGSTEKPIFSRKESSKRGEQEFSDQESDEGTP